MSNITNDYLAAVEIESGLFAVRLSDNGWSIADGPGTRLIPPDETELAGYHLPIMFDDIEQAKKAIISGPHSWFDIATDSEWTKHCLSLGAKAEENYLIG